MKYIQLFDSVENAVGKTVESPLIASIKGIDKIMYASTALGSTITIKQTSDGFISDSSKPDGTFTTEIVDTNDIYGIKIMFSNVLPIVKNKSGDPEIIFEMDGNVVNVSGSYSYQLLNYSNNNFQGIVILDDHQSPNTIKYNGMIYTKA